MIGAAVLFRTLEALGVERVYGVAGTQNVEWFEALRTSRLRVVPAPRELAAGFLANGIKVRVVNRSKRSPCRSSHTGLVRVGTLGAAARVARSGS